MTNNYETLERILAEAAEQASKGKGRARHAVDGERFESQQIVEIGKRLQGNIAAGPLFQAVKKVYESGRLSKTAAIEELKGAIVYIAAAIYLHEQQKDDAKEEKLPKGIDPFWDII